MKNSGPDTELSIEFISELLFHRMDDITLFAADIIRQVGLDLYLLYICVEMHQVLFSAGLHGLQGQINNFLDLPGAVSHPVLQVSTNLKIFLLC